MSDAAGEPLIEVRDAGMCFVRRRLPWSRRARHFWALRGVSFDVMPGETLGVVGRNAAGKSTLLRLLAGTLDPTIGSIRRARVHASLLSLQVGFVPHLNGRENAILGGMLLGVSKREIMARLDRIIEFSELGEFIDEPLSSYSEGMRARLGFSVAYYAVPEVLLIDEVLGVGDAAFQAKSTAAIHAIIRSNHTVVLVSHNLLTVTELCDRVIWLESGGIMAAGPTREVVSAYRAAFADEEMAHRTVDAGRV